MKKLMTIFGAILFASAILSSCSGSDKNTIDDLDDAIENYSDSNIDDTYNESSESEDISNDEIESSSSSDCDQFIKDYEEFVNSYIVIIKKMKANPSDMSIMSEYTEMASNASTMQSDAADCNDIKYAAKLSQLATKMANAAAGI
jgi:hypothetical protein